MPMVFAELVASLIVLQGAPNPQQQGGGPAPTPAAIAADTGVDATREQAHAAFGVRRSVDGLSGHGAHRWKARRTRVDAGAGSDPVLADRATRG